MPVGDKPVDLPDMPCGACDAGLAECVGDDAQSNRLMLRLQYADAEPHLVFAERHRPFGDLLRPLVELILLGLRKSRAA